MLASYIRSTFRVLLKEKSYTIIHISGLAVGLTTCLIIFSWVSYETSFDRHFDPGSSVYRIVTGSTEDTGGGIASTYPMVQSRLLPQFPEVEASARLFDNGFMGTRTKVTYHEKTFTDNDFYYGDASILKVFPIQMVAGDRTTALAAPNTIIISETTANKFFGHEDPIGKIIVVGDKTEFRVTGVIQDIPDNTHFHFDLLASMQSHPWIKRAEENVWSGIVFHTYVKLRDNASPEALEQKMRTYLDNFPGDSQHYGRTMSLHLQPVRSIHLESNLKYELRPNGNIMYVYLFSGVAMLVLALAIINYINLATARHMQRFKEVGVRKSMGASRTQLIVQFLTESAMVTLLAIVTACILLKMAAPLLSNLLGTKDVSLLQLIFVAAAISVCTIFAAGLFPAAVLSNYKPVQLIRSMGPERNRTFSLRKMLLIFQFAASMTLTICTFIIYRQLNFINEFKLGYDRNQVVILNISYPELLKKWDVLKTDLLTGPSIAGVTATSELPSDIQGAENIDVSKSQSLGVYCVSVDRDFFDVMGIGVEQGGAQIRAVHESDSINHFVLNASAIRAIGWNDADVLNRQISIRHGNMKPGTVVGSVGDFHFQSLHHAVAPLVMEFNPEEYQYLLVKVKPGNFPETIDFIADKWKAVADGIPFEYEFLDREFDNLYKTERKSSTMLLVFSALALFIALLGIFGLTLFAVQRRTKEIGLRKVLGARVGSIIVAIGKDFLVMLALSFLVAVPAGYLFMDSWLSRFALKTDVQPALFIVAGFLNFLLAAMVISIHGLKISATKPVDALRVE